MTDEQLALLENIQKIAEGLCKISDQQLKSPDTVGPQVINLSAWVINHKLQKFKDTL